MSGWDGNGNFSYQYSWVNDANNSIPITASRMDTQFNTVSFNGFGNTLTRDGQGVATANLPMAGFKHTGVAAGTALTDYADVQSVQNSLYIYAKAGGTVDAITAALSPAVTSLVDGQQHNIYALGANATTTPTYSPSGLTAHTITKFGGQALSVGDIPRVGYEMILRYDLTNTRWELLNPMSAVSSSTILAQLSGDASYSFTRIQKTINIAQSTTTDVFRFLDPSGTLIGNSFASGHFYINLIDQASSANVQTFIYAVGTTGLGVTSTFLAQLVLPGAATTAVNAGTALAASTAVQLVADGAGGAVKLQLNTDASGKTITARVSFVGIVK